MDAVVIAAIVGAAATLAAAAIGLWQWRRSESNDERSSFGRERVDTLRELWTSLSSLEEASRVNRLTSADFYPQMQALNNFLNLKAPLLRLDEQEWVRACVRDLQQIETILEAQPAISPGAEEWNLTGAMSPSGESLFAAFKVYQTHKELLSKRYQACLQGEFR